MSRNKDGTNSSVKEREMDESEKRCVFDTYIHTHRREKFPGSHHSTIMCVCSSEGGGCGCLVHK